MQCGWHCLLGLGQCPLTSVYRARSTVLNSRLLKSMWVYAKSLQLCLRELMGCGLPGSSEQEVKRKHLKWIDEIMRKWFKVVVSGKWYRAGAGEYCLVL